MNLLYIISLVLITWSLVLICFIDNNAGASWVQFDTPTRRVRYIKVAWLFFGITAWKAAFWQGETDYIATGFRR